MEDFNTIFENTLMKVCNINRNGSDVCIPTVPSTYRTTCKKLIGQTPFELVYGKEVVMPMEYIVPSMRIYIVTNIADSDIMEELLEQLVMLE